jgi:hypothetical protein
VRIGCFLRLDTAGVLFRVVGVGESLIDSSSVSIYFSSSLAERAPSMSDLELESSEVFLCQASSWPTFGGNNLPRPGSILLNGSWNILC